MIKDSGADFNSSESQINQGAGIALLEFDVKFNTIILLMIRKNIKNIILVIGLPHKSNF
ncbi:hypothetical protein ACN4EE_06780 [Geminocystis sp. CENA526]|uniref:hypothetical protein n=1 Tax=Geminocystis sp. CENA526 TaxID=1355871 RepID=UPI003D6FE41B